MKKTEIEAQLKIEFLLLNDGQDEFGSSIEDWVFTTEWRTEKNASNNPWPWKHISRISYINSIEQQNFSLM